MPPGVIRPIAVCRVVGADRVPGPEAAAPGATNNAFGLSAAREPVACSAATTAIAVAATATQATTRHRIRAPCPDADLTAAAPAPIGPLTSAPGGPVSPQSAGGRRRFGGPR